MLLYERTVLDLLHRFLYSRNVVAVAAAVNFLYCLAQLHLPAQFRNGRDSVQTSKKVLRKMGQLNLFEAIRDVQKRSFSKDYHNFICKKTDDLLYMQITLQD